jgi:hypothetical protein
VLGQLCENAQRCDLPPKPISYQHSVAPESG